MSLYDKFVRYSVVFPTQRLSTIHSVNKNDGSYFQGRSTEDVDVIMCAMPKRRGSTHKDWRRSGSSRVRARLPRLIVGPIVMQKLVFKGLSFVRRVGIPMLPTSLYSFYFCGSNDIQCKCGCWFLCNYGDSFYSIRGAPKNSNGSSPACLSVASSACTSSRIVNVRVFSYVSQPANASKDEPIIPIADDAMHIIIITVIIGSRILPTGFRGTSRTASLEEPVRFIKNMSQFTIRL